MIDFQTEGNAETLTIFIENKDGKIQKDLWMLNDAIPNDEQKWMEGRVEIKGSELSNDNAYRVCFSTQNVFFLTSSLKVQTSKAQAISMNGLQPSIMIPGTQNRKNF